MSESELFEGTEPVVETEDGFREGTNVRAEPDIDSEVDFDDEQFTDAEILIDEEEAGNAEGGNDAHLDNPEKVADDSTW